MKADNIAKQCDVVILDLHKEKRETQKMEVNWVMNSYFKEHFLIISRHKYQYTIEISTIMVVCIGYSITNINDIPTFVLTFSIGLVFIILPLVLLVRLVFISRFVPFSQLTTSFTQMPVLLVLPEQLQMNQYNIKLSNSTGYCLASTSQIWGLYNLNICECMQQQDSKQIVPIIEMAANVYTEQKIQKFQMFRHRLMIISTSTTTCFTLTQVYCWYLRRSFFCFALSELSWCFLLFLFHNRMSRYLDLFIIKQLMTSIPIIPIRTHPTMTAFLSSITIIIRPKYSMDLMKPPTYTHNVSALMPYYLLFVQLMLGFILCLTRQFRGMTALRMTIMEYIQTSLKSYGWALQLSVLMAVMHMINIPSCLTRFCTCEQGYQHSIHTFECSRLRTLLNWYTDISLYLHLSIAHTIQSYTCSYYNIEQQRPYLCILLQYYSTQQHIRASDRQSTMITKFIHGRISIASMKMIAGVGRFTFATTLQILNSNKKNLKTITKANIQHKVGDNLIVRTSTKAAHQALLSYNSIHNQYIKATHLQPGIAKQLKQLEAFRNKLLPNQSLCHGQDYHEYTLPKIISICLKHTVDGVGDKSLWDRLQGRVAQLLTNSSPIDNIILLYVGSTRFRFELRSRLIGYIQQEIKFMTITEKQFLFYALSHINQQNSINSSAYKVKAQASVSQSQGKQQQSSKSREQEQQEKLITKLNKIKQQIEQGLRKTKLSLTNLIEWVTLITVTNGPHTNIHHIVSKYRKIEELCRSRKNVLSMQQFSNLLMCLQYRTVLADQYITNLLRKQGSKFIQSYISVNANFAMLFNCMRQVEKIRLKMILSYYYPHNGEYKLSSDQLLNPELENAQRLRHLHWIWKNNRMQQYEIKSVYQSIQLSQFQQGGQKEETNGMQRSHGFKDIDIVYYICWLEMGLDVFVNHRQVIHVCRSVQYIPRGLQWPVYNYLAQLSKILVTKDSPPLISKSQIEQVIQKIKGCHIKYNKTLKLLQHIQNVKNSPDVRQVIQDLSKFFHQIKLWSFSSCQTIGQLDYVVHFVDHKLKIVVNCLNKQNYTQSQVQITNGSKSDHSNKNQQNEENNKIESIQSGQLQNQEQNRQQKNNQHKLNKKLLQNNLGYTVIDLDVKQFMKLNYNERIQFLRTQISNKMPAKLIK